MNPPHEAVICIPLANHGSGVAEHDKVCLILIGLRVFDMANRDIEMVFEHSRDIEIFPEILPPLRLVAQVRKVKNLLHRNPPILIFRELQLNPAGRTGFMAKPL